VNAEVGVFRLVRTQDASCVSGTGVVAYGTLYPNGKVTVAWTVADKPQSVAVYDSFEDMLAIHGHGGLTTAEWLWVAPKEA
jgi:hypothetical protein